MIIDKYKCIFVHIAKCGGCSLNFLSENNNATPTGHSTLKIIHQLHPRTKDYFSFTFVRNPWARLVSAYSMWKNMEDDHAFIKWDANEVDFCKKHSFKDFIHAVKLRLVTKPHTAPYIGYYFEKPSDMSFIGKLEQYQDDFNFICDQISFPRKEVPRNNTSLHKHYTKYYDHETYQIVLEKYAEDIKYFGYQFGE